MICSECLLGGEGLGKTSFSSAPLSEIRMHQAASLLRLALCTVVVLVVYVYNIQVTRNHHLNLRTLEQLHKTVISNMDFL